MATTTTNYNYSTLEEPPMTMADVQTLLGWVNIIKDELNKAKLISNNNHINAAINTNINVNELLTKISDKYNSDITIERRLSEINDNDMDDLMNEIDPESEDSNNDIIILPEIIQNNLILFNDSEKQLINMLIKINQSHLFSEWSKPNINREDDNNKHKFLSQLSQLDNDYPGGLEKYYENSINLLESSFNGKNEYDGFIPSLPDGIKLEFNSDKFNEYELLGKKEFGNCGFVLVAGGLGERLGYPGIKIELPIQITTEMTFIQYYIETILKFQRDARKLSNNNNILLPLAIMTSDDTHIKTVKLLEKNNYFGMKKNQIFLMKQGKVVALTDNDAHFAQKSPYELATKPHGHGDVHSLMHTLGVAKTMKNNFNTKWIIYFQDTNGIAMHSLPSGIGVSSKYNFAMNSITVPRKPGQAIGGIAKLLNKDKNEEMTCNVEYNQLNPLLLTTGDKRGDVGDETGYSKYPGNVNTFIIRSDTYINILNKTNGIISEFVNPKYTDNTKTKFKKPTRLECMMQDYPKLLAKKNELNIKKNDCNVGITQLKPWIAIEAVKNNMKDAIIRYKKIGEAYCGSSGEASIYYFNRQALKTCKNINIDESKEDAILGGIPVKYGARIVIDPSFGVTLKDIQSHFSNNGKITISQESTLVLDGNIFIENLELNGSLILRAKNNSKIYIKNLKVNNDGYSFKIIDPNDNNFEPKYQIRGYILDKKNEKIIEFNDGKEHIIDQ